MAAPNLNQETLKRLLHYDPSTGIFTWNRRDDVRPHWNGRYAGKMAGYNWTPPNSNVTYRCIRIFDWPFLAHRLAVLYMTGKWPTNEVDHHDLDGLNNRWSNLREATKAQNGFNRGLSKSNRTGFKGVCLETRSGLYRATIMVHGKRRELGRFKTAEEAHVAYVAAANQFHKQFARTA